MAFQILDAASQKQQFTYDEMNSSYVADNFHNGLEMGSTEIHSPKETEKQYEVVQ